MCGEGRLHEVVSAYAQTRCAFVACVVGILCAILRIPIRVYSSNSLQNQLLFKIRPFTSPSTSETGKYRYFSISFSYKSGFIRTIFVVECQQCDRNPAIFYIVVAFFLVRLPVAGWRLRRRKHCAVGRHGSSSGLLRGLPRRPMQVSKDAVDGGGGALAPASGQRTRQVGTPVASLFVCG